MVVKAPSPDLDGSMRAIIAAWVLLAAANIAALFTHIVVCIKAGTWGLLIAGAIMPPVGIIHGVGHWFGYW